MVRENISEEDYIPWFYMQENLFSIIKQLFLDEKLMKKFGMTQRIIRYMELFFISS